MFWKMEMRKDETYVQFECFPFSSLNTGTLFNKSFKNIADFFSSLQK